MSDKQMFVALVFGSRDMDILALDECVGPFATSEAAWEWVGDSRPFADVVPVDSKDIPPCLRMEIK